MKKKLLLITLMVALFVCMLVISASAATDIDGLQYTLDATEGKAKLTTDNQKIELAEVVIPATVTYEEVEYKVTMDKNAFKGNKKITSVTIAGSVSITYEAFSGCTSLQTLVIGEGNGGLYSQKEFYGCTSLKNVTLASTIKGITNSSFQNCSSIETLTLPSELATIGDSTFAGCKALKSIEIPSTVTSIGKASFKNCTSLESANIPANVKSYGVGTFAGCTSLKTITLESNTYFSFDAEEGVLYSADGKKLYQYLASNEATSFKIPDTVTSIEQYSFSNCVALETIEFSTAMTGTANYAFENCTSLKNIVFSAGLKTISDYTFLGCTSLVEVNLPSTLTAMYNYAFKDCSGIETIEIPSLVTVLNSGVFENCTSLKSVKLHDNITKIQCFSGCTSLESITLPTSLTYLTGMKNCKKLTSIYIPASVTEIGSNCFEGCTALASITFEKENAKLTKVGAHAFQNTSITEIVFPNSLLRIGQSCFASCSKLESVNLGASFVDFNAGNAGQPPFANGSTLKYVYLSDTFLPGAVRNNIFGWGDTNADSLKKNYVNLVFFFTGTQTQAEAIIAAAKDVNGYIYSAQPISASDYAKAVAEGTLVTGTSGSPSRYLVYGYNKCDAFYDSIHAVGTPKYTFDSYVTDAHMIGTCSQCSEQSVSETYAPIVSFLGHSMKIDGTAVTVGYSIDNASLQKYIEAGNTFNYGVVGYIPTEEEGNSYAPLTKGENGVEAINKQYTIHAGIEEEYASVDFVIKGFPQEAVSLIMCMYVYDGTDIVYLCGTCESDFEQVDTAYAVTIDVTSNTITKATENEEVTE